MKLYAVGTNDPNPENWNAWDDVELVSAESHKQAVDMCGMYWKDEDEHTPVAEVDMTKARHVMSMPPYIED